MSKEHDEPVGVVDVDSLGMGEFGGVKSGAHGWQGRWAHSRRSCWRSWNAGERLGGMSGPDLRLALQHALPASSPAELLPPPDAVSSALRRSLVPTRSADADSMRLNSLSSFLSGLRCMLRQGPSCQFPVCFCETPH